MKSVSLAKKSYQCDSTDGFVITRGTVRRRAACFSITTQVIRNKPVVLVGAMRPSTSMSADGPGFYNAVVTAADKQSASRGVLVVL